MRNKITAVWTVAATSLLLAAAPASAASASKQESIGVGAGAVVGAVAGGPIGFIIGAAVGAKIGDNFHKKSERIDGLQTSLQGTQNEAVELQYDVDQLGEQVRHLQNTARPELVSLMQAGIDMDLLFRTDEFALTDATGDRLAQLAATLANMPEIYVQLDGFADERGDADYNQGLSERRVEFVRNLFIAAGVHPTRISMSAHGEAIAQDANVDSFALERRVSVKLHLDPGAQDAPAAVAANP